MSESQQPPQDPSEENKGRSIASIRSEDGVPPPLPNISFAIPNPIVQNMHGGLPYAAGAVLTVQQSSSWQGPYPSPDAVERFERVLPGAFDRILMMAENAQASQIRTNENAQNLLQKDVRRSHYLGSGISVLALVCSTACALTDHPTVAIALVGIPVMAVAKALIDGRSRNSSEKDTDAEEEARPTAANTLPTPATPDGQAPRP